MNKMKLIFPALLVLLAMNVGRADDTNGLPQWLTRPLSLADALNTALIQNASILKAKNDLEASQGLVISTRAVALPHLTAGGQYGDEQQSLVQDIPFSGSPPEPHQNWATEGNPSPRCGPPA